MKRKSSEKAVRSETKIRTSESDESAAAANTKSGVPDPAEVTVDAGGMVETDISGSDLSKHATDQMPVSRSENASDSINEAMDMSITEVDNDLETIAKGLATENAKPNPDVVETTTEPAESTTSPDGDEESNEEGRLTERLHGIVDHVGDTADSFVDTASSVPDNLANKLVTIAGDEQEDLVREVTSEAKNTPTTAAEHLESKIGINPLDLDAEKAAHDAIDVVEQAPDAAREMVQDVVTRIVGKKLETVTGVNPRDVVDDIGQSADTATDWIAETATDTADAIKEASAPATERAGEIIDDIGQSADTAADWITETATDTIDAIGESAGAAAEWLGDRLDSTVDSFTNATGIDSEFGSGDGEPSDLSEFGAGAVEVTQEVVDAVAEGTETAVDAIEDTAEAVGDAIDDGLDAVGDAFEDVTGGGDQPDDDDDDDDGDNIVDSIVDFLTGG